MPRSLSVSAAAKPMAPKARKGQTAASTPPATALVFLPAADASPSTSTMTTSTAEKPSKRTYMCRKCKVHGLQMSVNSADNDLRLPHRLVCPRQNCACEGCQKVDSLRKATLYMRGKKGRSSATASDDNPTPRKESNQPQPPSKQNQTDQTSDLVLVPVVTLSDEEQQAAAQDDNICTEFVVTRPAHSRGQRRRQSGECRKCYLHGEVARNHPNCPYNNCRCSKLCIATIENRDVRKRWLAALDKQSEQNTATEGVPSGARLDSNADDDAVQTARASVGSASTSENRATVTSPPVAYIQAELDVDGVLKATAISFNAPSTSAGSAAFSAPDPCGPGRGGKTAGTATPGDVPAKPEESDVKPVQGQRRPSVEFISVIQRTSSKTVESALETIPQNASTEDSDTDGGVGESAAKQPLPPPGLDVGLDDRPIQERWGLAVRLGCPSCESFFPAEEDLQNHVDGVHMGLLPHAQLKELLRALQDKLRGCTTTDEETDALADALSGVLSVGKG